MPAGVVNLQRKQRRYPPRIHWCPPLTTAIPRLMMGANVGRIGSLSSGVTVAGDTHHRPEIGGAAMPKRAAGLSARKVDTQKAAGMFADGNGLYLQVTPTGAKSWIFRYVIGGRRRYLGLGSAAIVSL